MGAAVKLLSQLKADCTVHMCKTCTIITVRASCSKTVRISYTLSHVHIVHIYQVSMESLCKVNYFSADKADVLVLHVCSH